MFRKDSDFPMSKETVTGRSFNVLVMTALAVGALIVAGCGGSSKSSSSASSGSGTSTVKIDLISYSPFCDLAGGKPQGLEPELMNAIAGKLHISPQYSISDFAGQVAGVQAGRYDMGMCLFYWTKERTAAGVYTDPLMYAPIQVMQKAGGTISSISQFAGKTIGSITGYSWNPALNAVPGATVRLYPEYSALLADLAAGRVDVAPADALVNQEAIKARPDWHLQVSDLQPPTAQEIAQHPQYALLRPSQIAWYVSKSNAALAQKLSVAIRQMYKDGTLARVLQKYGANPQTWLVPPGGYIAKERQGVDRPANWQPPSIAK